MCRSFVAQQETISGNGSLMRILPACILLALDEETSEDDKMKLIHKVSGLTHNHLRSKMACGLYYAMVDALLHSEGESSLKNILQTGIDKGLKFYGMDKDNYYEMASKDYKKLPDFNIFNLIKS